MGTEIERKFLIKKIPADLNKYPSHKIEQAYMNVKPAIRVRKEAGSFYMTYKGAATGLFGQTEYMQNLALYRAK